MNLFNRMSVKPFADYDLKRLKEELSSKNYIHLNDDGLNALLARLETAESICKADTHRCKDDRCRRCARMIDWQKACGK